MKNKKWFWGIYFLLAAVFVIVSQFGIFGVVSIWSILATVILVAMLIGSVVSLNFFGIFLPLALFYLIYRAPLQLIEISPWLLILAAILASIGFSIIFRKRPHKWEDCHDWHDGKEHFNQTVENIDDNNPYVKVSFGASSKYLHGDCITGGHFSVSFGALEVYFDQAQLSPDGAEIFLDCSFGAIKLYVPRNWQVNDSLRASLGGVDHDKHSARPEENAPKLTLTGNVSLGGVEIHYI